MFVFERLNIINNNGKNVGNWNSLLKTSLLEFSLLELQFTSLFLFFVCFEIGSFYIVLAVLELTV